MSIVDLAMDTNGDFKLTRTGLYLDYSDNPTKVLIHERLVTNDGDYLLLHESAADLSYFVGRGIDPILKQDIVLNIKRALTHDGLFEESSINVIVIQTDQTSLYIRVVVTTTAGDITTDLIKNLEDTI